MTKISATSPRHRRLARLIGAVLAPALLVAGAFVAPVSASAAAPAQYSASGTVVTNADVRGFIVKLTRIDGDASFPVSQSSVATDGSFAISGGTTGPVYRLTIVNPDDTSQSATWSDSTGQDLLFSAGDRTGLTIGLAGRTFTTASIQLVAGSRLAVGDEVVGLTSFDPGSSFDGPQWYRNGLAIGGANGLDYVITAADQGTTLSESVYTVKRGYVHTTLVSPGLAIPAAVVVTAVPPTLKATAPKVTGKAKVGKTVRAVAKKIAGAKLALQWYANGKAIKKATKPALKLTRSLLGKRLTVKATYSKTGYVPAIVTSKPLSRVKK